MRHAKKGNHLGRTASHRSALLSNLANSLISHKRIVTTVAKAKALRTYIEPLLTKAKEDTMSNRRTLFAYLKQKESIKELYRTIAQKIADRPGGYTRIIKLGHRQGDGAETALIELVDFNTLYSSEVSKTNVTVDKKTTRRSRKKASSITEDTSEVSEVL